jgi:hypothetical protein
VARQFTGNTNKTAVLDAEERLRHAIDVLRSADEADRVRKAKSVRALAKRLYSARVHLLKARLKAAARAPLGKARPLDPKEASRLQAELASLTSSGIDGILAEFHNL